MDLRRWLALAAAALWFTACGGGSSGEQRPKRVPSLPQPGEYVYATRGSERLSATFSSGHRYPRRSTVTVERTACGYSERWEPRPERQSVWRFCTDGRRWRLASLYDYHEFFGQAVTQRFICRGPFVPRPPFVRARFRWTDRCRGAGSRVTVRYLVVGRRALRVGGANVQTVLIRARARLRGRIDGLNAYDSWLSRTSGLLVHRSVESETTVGSPLGRLTDRERYTLALRSPAPR